MKALFNITYGLYILTAKTDKFNGCVINTLMQVTSVPNRISITINKDNFTTSMIDKTGEFNVSILDCSTPFELIQRFGFSSGKKVDKFDGFKDYKLSKNGLPYITKHTNSYISAKVVSKVDVGTHIIFVADLTEDVVLKMSESLTYLYYLNNIKPKPEAKKKAWVCRICGYVYEGDELPEDFVCPICKHGREDFVLMEETLTKTENKKEEKSNVKYYCPICGNLENSKTEKCAICGASMVEVEV